MSDSELEELEETPIDEQEIVSEIKVKIEENVRTGHDPELQLYEEMCQWEDWQRKLKFIHSTIQEYTTLQCLPMGSKLTVKHLELFFNNLR